MIPRTSSVSINCVHQLDDDNAHNKTKTENRKRKSKKMGNKYRKKNLKLNGFVNQSDDNKLIDCNYENENSTGARAFYRSAVALNGLDYSITRGNCIAIVTTRPPSYG